MLTEKPRKTKKSVLRSNVVMGLWLIMVYEWAYFSRLKNMSVS